jgi:hypothetical protein
MPASAPKFDRRQTTAAVAHVAIGDNFVVERAF